MTTRSYSIIGMSCDHCVASVREEVGDVGGVTSVDVDLAAGRLVVTGERVGDADVTAAVEEAGYAVAA